MRARPAVNYSVGKRIRYYLIGLAVMASVAATVAAARAARGMPEALETEPSKILGNPNAPVAIIEFSDFQCPFCDKIRPILKKIQQKYPDDVKIIYKHYPLSIHTNAVAAAEASECAADQGKFWAYSDHLYDRVEDWYRNRNKNSLRETFVGYAKELGIDEDRFASCFASGEKRAVVDRNRQEGRRLLVPGTPMLFVNGRQVVISNTEEEILEKVQAEIRRVK